MLKETDNLEARAVELKKSVERIYEKYAPTAQLVSNTTPRNEIGHFIYNHYHIHHPGLLIFIILTFELKDKIIRIRKYVNNELADWRIDFFDDQDNAFDISFVNPEHWSSGLKINSGLGKYEDNYLSEEELDLLNLALSNLEN